MRPIESRLKPGNVLAGRYEILGPLGEGRSRTAFRVRDRELGVEGALRVLDPSAAADPEKLERFKREVLFSRQVSHENVVRIFDHGQYEGLHFITMELVDGQSLRERLESGTPLTLVQKLRIGVQLCAALETAHQRGVVHRNLKTSNVMIDAQGSVKLLGFGLAYSAAMSGLTAVGTITGTSVYMAPERWRGQKADARSDLYELGVLLYILFVGRRPFDGRDFHTLCTQHLQAPPPPLRTSPPLPIHLAAAILRCLEKAPERRFARAAELGEALEDVLRHELAPAGGPRAAVRPAAVPGRGPAQGRAARGRRAGASAGAYALLAALALAAGFLAGPFLAEMAPPAPAHDSTARSAPARDTPAPETAARGAPAPETAARGAPTAPLLPSLQLARQLFERGVLVDEAQPMDALRAYRLVQELSPGEPEAAQRIEAIAEHHRQLARQAAAQGEPAAALAALARAQKAAPEDAELGRRADALTGELLSQARGRLAAFDAEGARAILAAVLRVRPEDAAAAGLLDEAAARRGARQLFERAQARVGAGDIETAWNELGLIEASYPDWAEARELRRSIEPRIRAAEALAGARTQLRAGDLEAAGAAHERARRLDATVPGLAELRRDLEAARDRARRDSEKSEAQARHRRFMELLGQADLQESAKEFGAAILSLQRARELAPDVKVRQNIQRRIEQIQHELAARAGVAPARPTP
jgi:eukaryotic-like serine/threonine-protein kinase